MAEKKANLLKKQGNEAVQKGAYERAVTLYQDGLEALEGVEDSHYVAATTIPLLRAMLCGNISFARLKAKKYQEAARAAEQSLELSDQRWLKGYLRLLNVAPHLDTLDEYEICARGLEAACYIPDMTMEPLLSNFVLASTEAERLDVIDKLVEHMRKLHSLPTKVGVSDGSATAVKVATTHLCRVALCPILPPGIDSSVASGHAVSVTMVRPKGGILLDKRDSVSPLFLSTPPHILCTEPTTASLREFLLGFRKDPDHNCTHKSRPRQYYWGLGTPSKPPLYSWNQSLVDLESGYWGRKAVEERLNRQEDCRRLYGNIGAPETRWLLKLAERYCATVVGRRRQREAAITVRISSVLHPFINVTVRLSTEVTLAALAGKVIMPLFHGTGEYYFHDTLRGGAMFSRIPRGYNGGCGHGSKDAPLAFLHGAGARIDDSMVLIGDVLRRDGDTVEFVYDLGERNHLELERMSIIPSRKQAPIEVVHAQYDIRDIKVSVKDDDYVVKFQTGSSCHSSEPHALFLGPGALGMWQLEKRLKWDMRTEHTAVDLGLPDVIRTEECKRLLADALAQPNPYFSGGAAQCRCCPSTKTQYHVDAVNVALCATCGAAHGTSTTLGICKGCGLHYFCSEKCRVIGPHICARAKPDESE